MEDSKGATSVEVYGFAGWITSAVAYVLFLFWAYTPDEYLESIGITYYPSKYWAIVLPIWFGAVALLIFCVYESLNMMSVPPITARTNIEDARSKSVESVGLKHFQVPTTDKIPPLAHIHPAVASRVLHLD